MPNMRDSILEHLGRLNNLPTMNITVKRIQEALSRGQESMPSAAVIGKIIEKDLGLSVKILKIANSVYYGGRYGAIGNIGQAVARLGIEEVGRICTAIGSIQMFAGTTGNVDLKEFWKHSISVAIIMRHFAQRSKTASSCLLNAYTAGLFHDIGIIILDRYFADHYQYVLSECENKRSSLFETEKSALGIDHGEIGAFLCKKWRLPEEIVEAVAWHHFPDGCTDQGRKLTQLAHVANFTCSVLGMPEPGDAAVQMASTGAWHDLDIDNCDLNAVAEDVRDGISKGGDFVSLSI
jgi:putative nucleotidyltransferase with HDIG domain